MQSLLTFVGTILNGVRAAVGLVLPIFANAADFRRWPVWMKVLVQLGLLAGICALLYLVQDKLGLGFFLKYAPKVIAPYFLSLVFLLLVAFSWLAYGLWRLLTEESEAAEFPDILTAWSDAVARLEESGMRIGDAPLFLALGRPAAGLDALFLSAGVRNLLTAPQMRGNDPPPIRVYAWDEAIFVTCPGASAWGRFCVEVTDTTPADFGGQAQPEVDPGKTLNPGAAFAGLDPMMKAEMEDLLRESTRRELYPHEQARLRELAELASAASAPAARKVSIPEADRTRLVRRFRYLCKLIRKDRRPWCPLNGVMILVPWAATETDDLAKLGSAVLEQELSAAREVFQLRYPTFALITDLETTRGFDEFRQGFRADMLKQRIGQRIPLVPVGKPDDVANLIGNVAQWIGLSVLPRWILEFLRLEAGPDKRRSTGLGGGHNRNLYLLMRAVFDRGPRLAELLARGVPPVGGSDEFAGVPMFGGIYLSATGREALQQAFVPGVFQRVIESQNAVSWSPEALGEDARLNRTTVLGYVGALVLAAAAGAAVYLMMK